MLSGMPPDVLQRFTWDGRPREPGDLFVVTKDNKTARCQLISHQLGWQCWLLIGQELVQSQVCNDLESRSDNRGDVADIIEHPAILGLLEELNDAQVIILMAYGSSERTMGNPSLDAFVKYDPGVFVEPPTYGCDESVQRKWVMHQFYERHLVSLGLLKDTEVRAS